MSDRTRMIAPFKDLEEDLRLVDESLRQILLRRGGAVQAAAQLVFRGGGKRVHPALVLLSSRILGTRPEGAIPLAAAAEMVHNASLLHDDVIDQTTLRRGQNTVNALYGNRYTVLLGDFLLTQAMEVLHDLGMLGLVRIVSSAVAEMTLGQILELQHQGDLQTSTREYLRIIDGKTASLMAACCVMGGHLAQADDPTLQALERYGRHLGLAFQVIDDVLDFWGDPEALGKPVGSDLTERKFTLPFLLAMERADSAGRDRVRELMAAPRLTRADLDGIVSLMDDLGTREASLDLARQHGLLAVQELARLPAGEAREALACLPEALALRDR